MKQMFSVADQVAMNISWMQITVMTATAVPAVKNPGRQLRKSTR